VEDDNSKITLDLSDTCFTALKNFLYNNPSEINPSNVFDVLVDANKVWSILRMPSHVSLVSLNYSGNIIEI
jgi:hypothetical protein